MATSIGNNTSLLLPPDDFIREEINKYIGEVKLITLRFIQPFVSISGLLGNILALIVINRKSLRNTSSAVFITYMAIFDSAVLLLHAGNLVRPRRNLFIHCSSTYLTDLFTFCANWVLVIITLERHVAVTSPFLAKRFCTVKSARYSVYMLLTIAIIFFSTTFPIIYNIHGDSKRKKCIIRSKFELIHHIYQPIVMYGLPDLLLLSNLFTICSLFRQRKQQLSNREGLNIRISDVHSNRKQRQLTIMLVTVNLAFYLFSTPAMIAFIVQYSPPKHHELNKLKRRFLFSHISVLLLQLHNATNFIFYCLAGQRFRQATMETFNDYSIQLKFFYHRYILCDRQYRRSENYRLSNTSNTTGKHRASHPESNLRAANRALTI
ncbi:unnamed protein product [Rotaria sordida]|uniref:G-protein coupled receptors family 1 profile domain-containing protein n=1 Tax=Rotaria sordida TaxID=392033 RepID=A0A814AH54_9BILA|nr:unnamed protein product [Rotaria sordida]CAF4089237.1 unnamed protein product [Rotaria sordida]